MTEAQPLRNAYISLLLLCVGTVAVAQENHYGPIGGTVNHAQREYKEFVHEHVSKDKTGAIHVKGPNFNVDVKGKRGHRQLRVQAPADTVSKISSALTDKSGAPVSPAALQSEVSAFMQAPMAKIRQFVQEPSPYSGQTVQMSSVAGAVPEPLPPARERYVPINVMWTPNPEGSVP